VPTQKVVKFENWVHLGLSLLCETGELVANILLGVAWVPKGTVTLHANSDEKLVFVRMDAISHENPLSTHVRTRAFVFIRIRTNRFSSENASSVTVA